MFTLEKKQISEKNTNKKLPQNFLSVVHIFYISRRILRPI